MFRNFFSAFCCDSLSLFLKLCSFQNIEVLSVLVLWFGLVWYELMKPVITYCVDEFFCNFVILIFIGELKFLSGYLIILRLDGALHCENQ